MCKQAVVVILTSLMLVGATGCSDATTTALPTVTQTIVVSPSPTSTPLLPVLPSDQTTEQKRFSQAVDWVALATQKGTAASIYGLAKALNCVLTPQDWQDIQPYADILYQRATGDPLPVITSPTCDTVKGTVEEQAAKWYVAYQKNVQQ